MKKRALRLAAILFAGTLLAGCGNSSAKYDYAEAATEAASSYDYSYEMDDAWAEEEVAEMANSSGEDVGEVTESSTKSNRKLIRTVNIDVETYDFDELTSQIAGKVEALGGYVETSSVDGKTESSSSKRSASYTLRIPRDKADEFIAKIEGNSNVTHHSESQEDVTLSYVDMQSKKESLQVEYDRLEELLKDADNIDELIYIEERLAQVRYEIQSIESQLRTYDNKVDYTTINLYIREVVEYTEPEPVVEELTLGQRIVYGLTNAFSNISEFLQDLLVFVIVAIPYLILLAIPTVIVVLIVKACKKKSEKKKAEYAAKVASGEIEPKKPVMSYTATMEKSKAEDKTEEQK